MRLNHIKLLKIGVYFGFFIELLKIFIAFNKYLESGEITHHEDYVIIRPDSIFSWLIFFAPLGLVLIIMFGFWRIEQLSC